MIINCRKCTTQIDLKDRDSNIEGKLIICDNCKEEWIYHSQSYFLEGRLTVLGLELETKESSINKQNEIYSEKILILKNDLENKKKELIKQIELEKKVSLFENRITVTEKLNSDQAHLENEIFQLKKDLTKTSKDISSKNQNIEKKANYLEMKISEQQENSSNKKKIAVNDYDSGVVNFVKYDEKNNKEKKKKSFWSKK